MMTPAELDRIPLDAGLLEIIPEAFARGFNVLPLRRGVGSLHVVLASDAPERIEAAIQSLEFALDCKITYELAAPDSLAAIIDLHYSAANSEVQNCPRAFLFRCSKRWVDLARTDDDRVRHCDSCGTNVRLCKSDGELDTAIARGECVAYYDSSGEFLGIIEDCE